MEAEPVGQNQKVFGIGLNKTGTKTLRSYLVRLGFRHRSYDSSNTTESPSFELYSSGRTGELLDIMEQYDSCEDWPWPVLFRELDERFPDARFILTVRSSPDRWYRSLCNMAVRIGPLPLYEKAIYGYAMPQGHREEHIRYYVEHNDAVERYFENRPGKLLRLCWEDGDDVAKLAEFLGLPIPEIPPITTNKSPSRVYAGDNLVLAQLNRVIYQNLGSRSPLRRRMRRVRRKILG